MTLEQDTLPIRSKPMRSVRTLLLWLVLASLLPGVIVAAVLFVHQYQNGRAQLLKDMLQTARTQSLVVDKEMARIQGRLEILALSPTFQSGDLPAFYRHAKDIMATETLAGAIVLIDPTGQQVMNTLRPFGKELPKTGHPELLQQTFRTGQPSVSDLYIGGVAKSFFIAMEVPVWQGGKVVYGLDMGVPAAHLSKILLAQKLPQDWVIALLDGHGVIIARSQNAERFVGQKGPADLIEQMGKSKEGSLASHILEGAPAIVAFNRSASSGWTMAIGVPSQSLEAALLRTVALFGLGTAILFGLGVGVAWYMSGRIARSVQALTAPAMALEAGEAIAISTVHFREADEVARAMARTARLLKKRTQELHAAYETLQESEGRYRTLLECSLEGVAVHRDGKLLYVNLASIRMFGASSAQDLIGKPLLDFVHPDFHQILLERLRSNTVLGGVMPMTKMTLLKPDGTPIVAEVQSTLINYNGKPAVQVSIRDITERDKFEEALRRSRIELHKLIYHQDNIREDERRRIALDIHDSLGQNLMVLRIDMSLMSEHVDSVGVTKAEIDAIVEQIDTTIKSVRAIINDLRPAVLGLGLHAAVEWQAKEFKRHTGIDCELHIDHDEFAMDERVATALFRIVQEALTNIMRHAQATHVQIDMLKQDGQLVIQIGDDGIGLPANYVRRANAFGLVGIEERITVMGGTFAIDSAPGQGTTLILSVPLDVITTQQLIEQHRL
ncbi:MAG: PAS domain S-box protein [Burkholderiaceae bacterium]|nr:PAS domain S-box protein [Burkholderiaceae bacterium]